MQAKVPPATCFPHNKNAKRILRRSDGHPHIEKLFGVSSARFRAECKTCLFMRRKASALCVYYEMSNTVQQCQISSGVVAVVGFWLFCGTRFPLV